MSGASFNTEPGSAPGIKTGTCAGDIVLPVIQETLDVSKKRVDTGTVRLTKIIHEKAQPICEYLASELIEVERVPMDVIVAVAPSIRVEGDVTIIPVVEEILVVTKQLHLKEELRISKKRTISEHRDETALRSEEFIIERFSGPDAG